MKNLFVIIALVAVAGCSSMRPESRSSSGSMGADTRGSSASGGYPSSNYNADPSIDLIAPTMVLP